MAEWTNVAVQTVNPGESIVFTENTQPCMNGFILHRDDSGAFLLSGATNGCQATRQCACPCCNVNKIIERIDGINGQYGAEVLGFCFDTGHANLVGIDFEYFL